MVGFSCTQISDESKGGMEKVVLSYGEDCRVEVFLLGATVTSWICDGREKLYLSPNAVFNNSKAIRGGIPLVFPQFGQPNSIMPQHGFARTSKWDWSCGCHTTGDDSEGKCVFLLTNNADTENVWNHPFLLTYTVTLSKSQLKCELSIKNTSSSEVFECHGLLHTYIRLPSDDINRLTAVGFESQQFIDKMSGGEKFIESRETVNVAAEVDRIYINTPQNTPIPDITLLEDGKPFLTVAKSSRMITGGDGTIQEKPADVVFWNAWIDKSKALPDLGEGAYKSYVCVEPGLVTDYVSVGPEATLTIDTTLTVIS